MAQCSSEETLAARFGFYSAFRSYFFGFWSTSESAPALIRGSVEDFPFLLLQ
tara:strand:- start:548 stop:703 length:156 start_codon:yes stop_codon:yes gene_type:complete